MSLSEYARMTKGLDKVDHAEFVARAMGHIRQPTVAERVARWFAPRVERETWVARPAEPTPADPYTWVSVAELLGR